MEQKRTLWIIAAVGVFLLVVLGAALFIFPPTARSSQTIAGHRGVRPAAENGWIPLDSGEKKSSYTGNLPASDKKNQEEAAIADASTTVSLTAQENTETPASTTENRTEPRDKITEGAVARVGELTVYADRVTLNSGGTKIDVPQTVINNTTTIDLTGRDAAILADAKEGSSENREKNTVSAVSQKPSRSAATTAKASVKKEDVPAGSSTALKTQDSKSNVGANLKTKERGAKPKPVPAVNAAPEKTQYWVQVTSLTSRKNADTAREILGENRIPADVFTYTDSKNKLFYRVRVGPYTTKSEAEYWQARIAKIDSFKNTQSYVASTKVTQ